jgi:hypothetical protein
MRAVQWQCSSFEKEKNRKYENRRISVVRANRRKLKKSSMEKKMASLKNAVGENENR